MKMYIECTKGFWIGEKGYRVDSFAVMQGEIFELVDHEDNSFVGTNKSRVEGMEIDFTEEQLYKNFKVFFE